MKDSCMFPSSTPFGHETVHVLITQASSDTLQGDKTYLSHLNLTFWQASLFLFKEENDFAFIHLAGLGPVFRKSL